MDIIILTPVRLFGDSLAGCLASGADVSVVAIVNTFSVLRETFKSAHIDMALIDVTQGIDLDEVRVVAAHWPAIALLALGLRTEQQDVVRCARAGFAGYVPRDASIEQLAQIMRDVAGGRLSCPPEVAGEMFRALYRETLGERPQPGAGALTARECEVLRELGYGRSNKEIAREFGLSISTVKHHVHSVLEKLQVDCRAQAMRKVRDTPWILGSSDTRVDNRRDKEMYGNDPGNNGSTCYINGQAG
jgi:DNA-binding NarL/FixJ family response regulator